MKPSLAIAYAVKRRQNKSLGGEVEKMEDKAVTNEPEMAHLPEEDNPFEDEEDHFADGGMCYADGGKVMPKLGSGKRFENLEHSLAHKPGIHDPKALAAAIGRKKFGAHKMAMLSAHGKKMSSGGWVEDESGDEFEGAPWLREDHMPIDPYREVGGMQEYSPNAKGDEMKEEDRLKRKRGMLHSIMSGLHSHVSPS